MAQIFGCFLRQPDAGVPAMLSKMAALMRRPTQDAAKVWCASASSAGVGALLDHEVGGLATASEPRLDHAIVIDGGLRRDAGRLPESDVLALYQDDSEFIRRVSGSFAFGLVDAPRRRLLCATDRFATRSLYWTHRPGLVAFSTEIKALLALPGFAARVDPDAIAAYLRYGRLFGARTLWRDVYRLPPATVLEFDAAADTVRLSTHWRIEDTVCQRQRLTPERLEAVRVAFRDAVLGNCPAEGEMGLSLSGGLDSRAILAVLAAEKRPVRLRTEGVAGCVDQKVTARLAAQTGYPWRFSPLHAFDIAQYVAAMQRCVYLTEGMMVPDGYPGVSAQCFAREENLVVLQRGHGGENARLGDAWPFQLRDSVLELSSRDKLARYLEQDCAHNDELSKDLFLDPEIRRAIASPADAYGSFMTRYDHQLSPAEVLSLMYLHINESGSVAAYRNCLRGYVDMAVPFADDAFLELVLGTRVDERRDSTIHHEIIGHSCPPLMRIPNSNNGAPLDASRLRLFVTDKFQSLMRRLNLPGFRHYHNVEKWIQSSLRDSIRALLLEKRTRERGVFNPAALKTVLSQPEHSGHARLLTRIVMLEMWHRMFVDREVETYRLALDANPDCANGSHAPRHLAASVA